jgi:hypothetical protein
LIDADARCLVIPGGACRFNPSQELAMYCDICAPRIPSNPNSTPRQAIKIDSEFAIDLPIRGGWGYGFDDA